MCFCLVECSVRKAYSLSVTADLYLISYVVWLSNQIIHSNNHLQYELALI